MSWKEIITAVNSDITTPLNSLINELSDEEITLLNSIISKLDNTTYGLSAIKTMLSTVNTNAALLKNTTYGLSALKTLINGINTNVNSVRETDRTYKLVTSSTTVTGSGILHTIILKVSTSSTNLVFEVVVDGTTFCEIDGSGYSLNYNAVIADPKTIVSLASQPTSVPEIVSRLPAPNSSYSKNNIVAVPILPVKFNSSLKIYVGTGITCKAMYSI